MIRTVHEFDGYIFEAVRNLVGNRCWHHLSLVDQSSTVKINIYMNQIGHTCAARFATVRSCQLNFLLGKIKFSKKKGP